MLHAFASHTAEYRLQRRRSKRVADTECKRPERHTPETEIACADGCGEQQTWQRGQRVRLDQQGAWIDAVGLCTAEQDQRKAWNSNQQLSEAILFRRCRQHAHKQPGHQQLLHAERELGETGGAQVVAKLPVAPDRWRWNFAHIDGVSYFAVLLDRWASLRPAHASDGVRLTLKICAGGKRCWNNHLLYSTAGAVT